MSRLQRIPKLLLLALVALGATLVALLGGWGEPNLSAAPSERLRIAVLGGPEQELIEFVARQNPELRLEAVVYPSVEAARGALQKREVAAGSFETAHELVPAQGPARAEFEAARSTLTLPFAFYSKTADRHVLPHAVRVLVPSGAQQGRALALLRSSGWLSYPEERAESATIADISGNPFKLTLVAQSPSQLASAYAAGEIVGLNYQAARALGLSPAQNALLIEDAFTSFAQVLTVRAEDKANPPPELTRFVSAYGSRAVKNFILEHFQNNVKRPW